MPTAALADEAEKLLDGGFRAVKIRLGPPRWKRTSPPFAPCGSASR